MTLKPSDIQTREQAIDTINALYGWNDAEMGDLDTADDDTVIWEARGQLQEDNDRAARPS